MWKGNMFRSWLKSKQTHILQCNSQTPLISESVMNSTDEKDCERSDNEELQFHHFLRCNIQTSLNYRISHGFWRSERLWEKRQRRVDEDGQVCQIPCQDLFPPSQAGRGQDDLQFLQSSLSLKLPLLLCVQCLALFSPLRLLLLRREESSHDEDFRSYWHSQWVELPHNHTSAFSQCSSPLWTGEFQ